MLNKEYLEAFKNLKQELYYSPNQIPDVDKWHETIEQALQRLEAIDNAKPSEALERIKSKIIIETEIKVNKEIGVVNPYYTDYLIIKQALLKAQEQEKVLEIIFKKTVGIFQLSCCKNVYEYNDLKFDDYEKLTQEEFDVLKKYRKGSEKNER